MAKCIGCGRPKAKQPHTYCRRCRDRVNAGIAPDADDVPTRVECEKANRAMDAYLAIHACATTA